jgi:RNA polymerase sigma factor (sigma-70 family)
MAEDLVQESFLRLLQSSGYQQERPFKPWLYAIATNLARDYFKSASAKHQIPVEGEDCLSLFDKAPGPEEVVLATEENQIIAAAIGQLGDEYRSVLLLRFYQDWQKLDLETMLLEQGEEPEEIANLVPALQQLEQWQAPQPTSIQTQRLLARLASNLPQFSPVRLTVRTRHENAWKRLLLFLEIARVQVSLLRPAFWLLSILVMFLGGMILVLPSTDQSFVLRIVGPGLAYICTLGLFRGTRLGMLECELSCPPSLQQLTLARLLIVLGYDASLGILASLLLRLSGEGNFLLLVADWLFLLLLVTGLALFLSLRFSMQVAASVAYGCWVLLAILLLNLPQIAGNSLALQLATWSTPGEICIGLLGMVLLLVPFWRLNNVPARQLLV